MAVDMMLKIDSVTGESVITGHENEIDLLAWSWGMRQSGSMHVATGGGSGKVDVHDINITKYLDKSTPVITQYCCSGKHFRNAKLTVRKAGGSPVDYLVIEMENVLISSVNTGGSSSEDRLTENVALNFSKFKVVYKPQNPDGSAGADVSMGFDIAKNTLS